MRRWWIPALLALGIVLGSIAVACSSRSDNKTIPSAPTVQKSTGGTEGGPDKVVQGPASRYAPLQNDLPGVFNVNVPETFTQNISTFASSYLFTTAQQGQDLGNSWKILDGFKVEYDPDGLNAAVLKGSYFVNIEVYLFQDTAGAHQAYAFIANKLGTTPGSKTVPAKGLGNESSAYQIVQGTVATSDMVSVYHRFLFRRGNIVASVQTTGGKPFMTVDYARNIAVIMDNRILGKSEATVPTPIPTPAINIPPTPVPSGTSGAGS